MCLAVPGRITAVNGEGEFRTARVEFGGVAREASLVFVPEAAVGDYVLVHVGFAIARLDEAAAAEALEALQMLEPQLSDEGDDAAR